MSKEFQEEAKRLGLTGSQLIQKYREEGILDITNGNDYRDRLAQNRGFKDRFEMYKKKYEDNKDHILFDIQIRRWKNEVCSPQWENENCATYLGVEIGERIVGRFVIPILVGNIEKEMPYGNPGYDFVTVDRVRIDVKAGCLKYNEKLCYTIHYNNIANKFLLIGFDNRTNLNVIHMWLFSSNDNIRRGKFWKRDYLTITNKPKLLVEFENYEVTSMFNLDELSSKIKMI